MKTINLIHAATVGLLTFFLLASTAQYAQSAVLIGDPGAGKLPAAGLLSTDGFKLSSEAKIRSGTDLGGGIGVRSPYEGLLSGALRPYYAVTSDVATAKFDRAIDGLSFIWGSPDTYNYVAGILGGKEQFRFTGAALGDTESVTAKGAWRVRLQSFKADTIVFGSTGASFEFANIKAMFTDPPKPPTAPEMPEVAPVPLPAAGMLLIGALAGLGFVRRRRGS